MWVPCRIYLVWFGPTLGSKEMMENIKCYDDLSFGAGRIDG